MRWRIAVWEYIDELHTFFIFYFLIKFTALEVHSLRHTSQANFLYKCIIGNYMVIWQQDS
jgi:hypothetical protein